MALAHLNREKRAVQKEAKAQYLADRTGETDDLNAELQDRMQELRVILGHTLSADGRINFDTLQPSTKFELFETPPPLAPSQAPRVPSVPPPLASWPKLIPGATTRRRAQERPRSRASKKSISKRTSAHALRRSAANGVSLWPKPNAAAKLPHLKKREI
ncbi:hypothetical protein [Xylophilus sp. GOD-11R]|uniref:hypothetical protein n=1 Tax=Xylophilus sp. GOD-11R TaxID=3089814 RepID=UPI00298D0C5B|nr:hypothetical protein [Xylophilus sp. GOD-11R]WPB57367.1 hypothetical protein R9X41_01560 [Xylophilus sp. GOD-11R]